ncbi:MAG: gliding motility lipoprotein GldB [Cyclobacteriaceae bacterium]
MCKSLLFLAMRILLFLLLLSIVAVSCDSTDEKCEFIPDTSSIQIDLLIEPLHDRIAQISSKEELVLFFSGHPTMRDQFFNRQAYPSDSAFINELYNRFTNPYFDSLLIDTDKVFGDLAELTQEFETAFSNIKYYYPDFEPPKIQTVITGLESDILVTDSLIIVGLDYYIGPGARYKPNMYDYMLRRYQKNFIVPSVLLLYGIDSKYNKTDLNDRTVLSDMIAYGKAYHFAKHMLPCVPDSVLIGYTSEELQGAKANEDLIWKRLVQDEVLYATNHLVKQKYIAERPKTLEVGDACPGRIATWVGWEIIRKYSERHPDISLPRLMETAESANLFTASNYRPL